MKGIKRFFKGLFVKNKTIVINIHTLVGVVEIRDSKIDPIALQKVVKETLLQTVKEVTTSVN